MKRYHILIAVAAIFLALTGFECASTEMTTAKTALKTKDFKKAEEALKKEVATRPGNGQAWYLLGEMYYEQERFAEMSTAFDKAEAAGQPALTPQEREVVLSRRFNTWVTKFNRSRDLSEQAAGSDRGLLTKALAQLDTAELLRPGYPDHIFLRASIYSTMDDKAMTDKAYRDYIQLIGPDVERGIEMGMALGMTLSQLESRAGKPDVINVSDTAGGFAQYKSKNLYVFFAPGQSRGAAQVEGWKFYGAGDPTPENLRSQLGITLRSTAYYLLGYDAYAAGETNPAKFNEALNYLQIVERFDPERSDVGGVVADIYMRTNRIDEAMKRLDDQIRRDPKNPLAYISYGNIYNEKHDFARAADKFKSVLDLGLPDYDKTVQTALFNLGAVYKNWGASIQDSINAVTKGKPNEAQVEIFRVPLRESVKHFERLKAVSGRNTDFILLTELANLYDVLSQTDKVKRAIAELEAIQQIDNNAGNARYWRSLSRLYSITGEVKKAEIADKKASELGG